jgi:hypothetical protein
MVALKDVAYLYNNMSPEEFAEKAAKFFPKAKDWPPPGQQRTITPEEAVSPNPLPKIKGSFINPTPPN